MKKKIPASSFPILPTSLLSRLMEEWRLPRKNQKLPKRSLDARRLAMRLRMVQASIKNEPTGKAGESDTWRNIMDYLDACMQKNDFKTLEVFCEGFLGFAGIAAPVADGEAGFLQKLECENDPASSQVLAILRAIRVLQGRKGFPPYQREIIEYVSHHSRGRDIQNLSAADTSKVLKSLNLLHLLPKDRLNP